MAQGSLAYFGTYSVNEADKSYTVRIEGSSFLNQNGTDGKRIVTSLTGDELKVTNPARLAGGQILTVWKRAK